MSANLNYVVNWVNFCVRPRHWQKRLPLCLLCQYWNNSGIGYSILKIDYSRIAILEFFWNWLFWDSFRIAILELLAQ
jgi:hypothetical protein